ncbi:MAG: LysE family translocator [Rhizobiales bacterium]|nr:LysE family translocator [Hyphomicrobiales bacterium]
MLELTIALVIFLFPLAYSPGPGNLFFAANGARFGLSATMPAMAGYHVATLLITLAIGLGFVAALDQFPHLFIIVKWAGSVYVLYLAWKFLRAGVMGGAGEARPAGFLDGGLLLILNPKAYMIIILMFAQFLGAASGDYATAVLWISLVFTLNNLIAFTAWALIGDQILARFRDTASSRGMNLVFGTVLAGVAIWMMLF